MKMNWKKTAAAFAWTFFTAAALSAQYVLPPSGVYVQNFDGFVAGQTGELPEGWYVVTDEQILFSLDAYTDTAGVGAFHFNQTDDEGTLVRSGVGFVGAIDTLNPVRLVFLIQDTENRTHFRIRFRVSNLTGGQTTTFAFDYSPDGQTFYPGALFSGPGNELFELDLPQIANLPENVYLRWTYQTDVEIGDAVTLDSLSLSFDALVPDLSVEIEGETSFCENQSRVFSVVANAEWDSLLWTFNGDTLAFDVETVEVSAAGTLALTLWANGDSATAQTQLTTLAAPDGANIVPGSQFQGTPGENGEDDVICPNRTAQYRIQTPPGYTGAQFNQRWNYVYTLTDDLGQTFSGNVQVTNPAPNGDAFLRFTPSDAYLGRILTLFVRYRDLLTACTYEVERRLSVNGPLTPSVDLNTEVCVGVPVVVDPQVAAAAYLWSTGANTPTLTVTLPGNYWLRLTDENGCTSRTDFTVALRSGPAVDLGPDLNACQSQTLDAGPGAAYLWSTGATTRQITVTASGLYHVRVKDEAGCEGRDTVAVVVSQPPVNALPATAGFCPGQTLTLSTGNDQDPHLWSTGATTPTLTVAAPGTYSVRVVRGACEVVKSVEVTQFEGVTVKLGDNLTACKTLVLDAGNIGAASYLWNTGATTRTLAVNQPGTYSVTVVNAQGCSGVGSVNVNFIPEINVSIFGPDSAETGEFVDFSAVVTGGNPDFWLWDFDNGTLSKLPNASYGFYRNPGTYTVKVVAGRDFCRDTATKTLVVYGEPLSVASNLEAFEFRVYPNPVKDGRVVVRLNRPSSARYGLTLSDVSGKTIEQRKTTGTDLYAGLEIEGLRPGLYLVRLTEESGVFRTLKLVVSE